MSVTGKKGEKTDMSLREYVGRFRGTEAADGTDQGVCARAHEGKRVGVRDDDTRESEECARARAGNVGYLRGWVVKPLRFPNHNP